MVILISCLNTQHAYRGYRVFSRTAFDGTSVEVKTASVHHSIYSWRSNSGTWHAKGKADEAKKLLWQTRLLPDLQAGEHVRMQRGETWQPAVVVNQHQQPWSFIVCTLDGRVYRRNRKHLLKTGGKEFPPAPTDAEDISSDKDFETQNTDTEHQNTEVTQDSDTVEEQGQSKLHHTRSGRRVKISVRFRDQTYTVYTHMWDWLHTLWFKSV